MIVKALFDRVRSGEKARGAKGKFIEYEQDIVSWSWRKHEVGLWKPKL